MTNDKLDLNELERLEREATPEPWELRRGMICHPDITAVAKFDFLDWICSMQGSNAPNWEKDAVLIATLRNAASPRTSPPIALTVAKQVFSEAEAHPSAISSGGAR